MQRLYSMFPGQAPGVALLLLRASIAVSVLLNGAVHAPTMLGTWDIPLRIAIDVLLVFGVFTPWVALSACIVTVLDVIVIGLSCAPLAFLTGVNAVALGLLGPGAYSFDARMFGRRRLVLPSNDTELP